MIVVSVFLLIINKPEFHLVQNQKENCHHNHFLLHRMGYDPSDSFPFDFEPNEIQFCSKSKGKLSPRSYPIQFERKWK